MSFLDDLLTFERPLSEGIELEQNLLPPRKQSFFERIRKIPNGEQIKPKETFRVHETKGGLYVVLKHDENDEIISSSDDSTIWAEQGKFSTKLPEGFKFKVLSLSIDNPYNVTSKIKKEGKQYGVPIHFCIEYTINQEGTIVSLDINYDDKVLNYLKGRFLIRRSEKDPIVTSDIEIATNYCFDSSGTLTKENEGIFALFNTDQTPRMDYELTIKNLIDITKKKVFTHDDFRTIMKLDYVSWKERHPYR